MHVLFVRVLLALPLPLAQRTPTLDPTVLGHVRCPRRVVALEGLPRGDAVARRVLHVDVEVCAGHLDGNVKVHLQGVRDALFDAEGVRRGTRVPARELGGDEVGADEGEEEGRDAAMLGAGQVG